MWERLRNFIILAIRPIYGLVQKMRYYSENSLEKVRNKGPRQPLST